MLPGRALSFAPAPSDMRLCKRKWSLHPSNSNKTNEREAGLGKEEEEEDDVADDYDDDDDCERQMLHNAIAHRTLHQRLWH